MANTATKTKAKTKTGAAHKSGGSFSNAKVTTADLTDIDGLLDKTRDLYEVESKRTEVGAVRLANLVLMRESGANDWMEAEGLVSQAASLYPDIDGIDLIAALGVRPLRTKDRELRIVTGIDEATGQEIVEWISIERLEVGTAKGVLFEFRGTAYLYSMASAAKVDSVGHQDWTRMLIRVLRQYRPITVRAVSVSRYTRNLEVAGLLLHAFTHNTDSVWAGALELTMKGVKAGSDKLLFTMLAMAAALERDALVSRMMAGKLHVVQSGRWLPGKSSIPPGHVMKDRVLVANPTEENRAQVHAILEAVAEDLGPSDFAKVMGRAGIRMRPEKGIRNGTADGADGADGVDGVDGDSEGTGTVEALLQGRSVEHGHGKYQRKARMIALVPLWTHGITITKLPNPFPGATHIGNLPVVVDEDGRESVHAVTRVELPPGGWADQDLLNAALVVAARHSNRANVVVSDALKATLPDGLAQAYANVATDAEFRAAEKPQKASLTTLWAGTSWSDDDYDWTAAGRGTRSLTLSRTPKHLAAHVTDSPTDIDGHAGVTGLNGSDGEQS